MTIVKYIFLIALFFAPSMSLAQQNHFNDYQEDPRWWPDESRDSGPSYRDRNDNQWDRPYGDRRHDKYEKRHRNQERFLEGWDVPSDIARRSPNCYRYTLSVDGNRGSARISPLPGTDYIQTSGQKSGYVCFDGSPTLELGKLGDRNTRVTLRLEGRGKYTFNRGDQGSNYQNNWYRSYWGL